MGPRYSSAEIRTFLDEVGANYRHASDEKELLEQTAQALCEEKVVGWFQGRMEFGPRALGARSIIGDPRSAKMQATMNLKIKFRESFRPFAPCVLREHVHEWFAMRPGEDSPYMLLIAPVLGAASRSAFGRGQRAAAAGPRPRAAREHRPQPGAGHHARRLQRPRADGG